MSYKNSLPADRKSMLTEILTRWTQMPVIDVAAIDAFFDSLGSALRERSVGIVLSGTGNDRSPLDEAD